MNHLRTYHDYVAESKAVSIGALEVGVEVTYRRVDGSTGTKRIRRIDFENKRVYFLDSKMKEFGKGINDLLSVKK